MFSYTEGDIVACQIGCIKDVQGLLVCRLGNKDSYCEHTQRYLQCS